MPDETENPTSAQTPPGTQGADPNAALLAELTQLKAWRAQREVADQQAAEQKRLDDQRKLAEKGQIEELVKQHGQALEEERKKAAQAAERFKTSERNRELALAIAGHNLVPGAAQQLMRLWADEFEVVDHGDGYQVRSKDLKAPKDWVAAKLAAEEYAHFVRAGTQGGAGAAGTHQVGAGTATDPKQRARDVVRQALEGRGGGAIGLSGRHRIPQN